MILIDTREQANTHILRDFEKAGIIDGCESFNEPIEFGDYYSTETNITVERKKNLTEFAGNCGKGHARFKNELEKLKRSCGKMYILIEQDITYEEMESWVNPKGKIKYRKLRDGTVKPIRPMNGHQMKAICDRWLEQYDIEFIFCTKKQAGNKILELLEWTS